MGGPSHPLGPLVRRVHSRRPSETRAYAAVVVIVCLGLLGVARWLAPSRDGLGTHTQLGFLACSAPVVTGYPCPTCGMTTAFALTVRGRWWEAFNAQPTGWALCVLVMVTAVLAGSAVVTGKSWRVNWYRISPVRVVLIGVGLLLAGWAYKIVAGLADGSLPASQPLW